MTPENLPWRHRWPTPADVLGAPRTGTFMTWPGTIWFGLGLAVGVWYLIQGLRTGDTVLWVANAVLIVVFYLARSAIIYDCRRRYERAIGIVDEHNKWDPP